MAPSTPFAHASEAEMARILDFYAVRWEYEPDTFPILWNLDGDVIESFSPDFYLPDLDLYLEMTTLRQKLVRKKNRKLRRLRELYPAVRIKLFYARDFRALMLKYGKLALHDDLAGTSGQVALPHGEREEPVPVALPSPVVEPVAAALAVVPPLVVADAEAAPSPAPDALADPDGPARHERPSRSARRRRRAAAARSAAIAAAPSDGSVGA
jgi:hypoxanthine phosphoribosyltransferase